MATETFTTSGSWNKPAGVTEVTVECWGGGGAGGGCTSNNAGGGGGAGGQYAIKVCTYTSGASTISYTVAAQRTGTTGNGSAGFDTEWNSSEVLAKGGAGGTANNGAGGTGSTTSGVGDTVYRGGSGAAGSGSSGGGGGGAGSTGNGGDASGTTAGTGTSENGGDGGAGRTTSVNGASGSTYGGGGSGGKKTTGSSRSGGTGAAGAIRITYTEGASAALTGTITNDTEADIVAGGSTIILTLTGDTFIAAGTGPIGSTANTQALIDGLDSAQAEGAGWDAVVKAGLATTDVVRTSDTVATITLPAFPSYNITATETITATIPAEVLTGAAQVVASPTFNITPVSATKALSLLGVG